MIANLTFILQKQEHLLLIMKVIKQTIYLFKLRYYNDNKIAGNPHDLEIALYLNDCLTHILEKKEFFELNYLSNNDHRKMLNIIY